MTRAKPLRYLSVCSGIEAATAAWHPLGWTPAAFSEIEAFPRAVLAHHYPAVPLHGDFTTIEAGQYGPIDILVGGTPCQDFSVAGLRAGITGDRGNLTLEFLRLAARTKPRWIVWENVPGVLSSDGGRALGAFLGGLVQLGYGFAYRVLDAQYFGLAQRRARVFVVGHLGDWRRAAAVLFERESLLWDRDPSHPLAAGAHPPAVAFESRFVRNGRGAPGEIVPPLKAQSGQSGKGDAAPLTMTESAVRRLTPRECERLQGFPDDYTLVPYRGKPAADGNRYKALGNSMAVPVMRWIGQRIALVDKLQPLDQRTEAQPAAKRRRPAQVMRALG